MVQINPTQLDGNPLRELKLSDIQSASEDILKASGLTSFVQRYTFTDNNESYFIEFDNLSPRGEIRPLIFKFERDEAMAEGWKIINLSLKFAFGSITFLVTGHYFREPVPVDFSFTYTMNGSNVVADSIVLSDRRIDDDELTSLKEVMSDKLKSGDPKYAGSNDVYGDMDFSRILKVINRFLKDWTTRHRFIEKD
ncbi:MAG: hypothetical protein JXR95_13670 [Deltaproteobacteria bacterium]|nr:hypothetical protein [Deltaproteobacteria bacterium]